MKSCLNFSQRTYPIHSIGSKTHILGRFGPFRCCTKVDAKLAELEPLTDRFAKWSRILIFCNPTHPIHSIGPKTHVLGHLGPFRYCTKVDAILDEQAPLTTKFAKWNCVGFFRNERMWSTPLDPKLIFWGVSDRFVAARKCLQNWSNWCH
jgi:hypothetical protein